MRSLKIGSEYTNRDSESLEKYLKEIAKFPLLTADKEVEYTKRIRAGDMKALEMMTKSNLRFVVSVAKKYQNQGLTLPDLINEGNLGLIKAAHRFDETRGFKFISYAVWWIRQSIMLALSEHARIVRLPMNKIGSLAKINKAFAQLEQEYEREPNEAEIAETLEMSLEDVADAIRASDKHLSLDELITKTENGSFLDLLPAEETQIEEHSLTSEFLKREIERALKSLAPREAEILRMYFGLNTDKTMTLQEIGEHFNLSRERVRQVRDKAIRRLQHTSYGKVLKAYVE